MQHGSADQKIKTGIFNGKGPCFQECQSDESMGGETHPSGGKTLSHFHPERR
jgi:hypothetical protein